MKSFTVNKDFDIDTYTSVFDTLDLCYVITDPQLIVKACSDNVSDFFPSPVAAGYDFHDLKRHKKFGKLLNYIKNFIHKDVSGRLLMKIHDDHGNNPVKIEVECKWLTKEEGIFVVIFNRFSASEDYENYNTKQGEKRDFEKENKEMQLQLDRLNAAVMQSANTIVITDFDGNILFANPKFEDTTGYKIADVINQNPSVLKSGDQPSSYYEDLWNTIKNGKVWQGEFKNKRKDGSFYWESATITPLKDEHGRIVEFLAIKEEITERKIMEERLEDAFQKMEQSNFEQRMLNKDLEDEVERRKTVESELKLQKDLLEELNENLENQVSQEVERNREKDQLMILQSRQAAMGEMIGNIAHQWRQPLNAIGLMIYDLTDAYKYGELTPDYLAKSEQKIRNVLDHMSATIDDFRNFFKPNKEKQFFKLNEMINSYVSFVNTTFKNAGVVLNTDIEHDILIYGYANEFAQVILNIVNNAKDAVIEKNITNPGILIKGKKENDKAIITITDNGGGVPDTIIFKIFDPYFSTKEEGKGTGIGLYMSKTIVEKNMGGSLQVENVRNGAKFTITIPLEKS